LNVFDFRQHLVNEYSEFTRSFTRIKADDIQSYVTRAYDSQKYWPEPLIQVNPNFKPGGTVQQLVEAGQLHPQCAEIFRLGKSDSSVGIPLPLHTHQQEAISLAAAGESSLPPATSTGPNSTSYARRAMPTFANRGDSRRMSDPFQRAGSLHADRKTTWVLVVGSSTSTISWS
jgi:hypothetical protein